MGCPQPTTRTSWKLVGKPGCQPGLATSFQLVRLVGCGLYRLMLLYVSKEHCVGLCERKPQQPRNALYIPRMIILWLFRRCENGSYGSLCLTAKIVATAPQRRTLPVPRVWTRRHECAAEFHELDRIRRKWQSTGDDISSERASELRLSPARAPWKIICRPTQCTLNFISHFQTFKTIKIR